jgi:DNA-binding response OmpR family regulator
VLGEERTEEGARAPWRILLVGEGEEFRQLERVVVSLPGYAADRARDSREALQRIACAPPDLVLLDFTVPELDGWQVLRRLRRQGDPPVVAILSPFVESARVLEAGAAACIRRPFQAEQLLGICERALSAATPTPGRPGRQIRAS